MSNTRLTALPVAATLLLAAAGAHADYATLTADNHYAFYTGSPFAISMVGHNESGSAGSSGAYNWSVAESWEFEAGDWLYVAAWSDDAVAQGFLGHFDIGETRIRSGDAVWEVFATGIDLDDGAAAPSALDIQAQVAHADTNDLWTLPMVFDANGVAPWNSVADIDPQARWMWATPPQEGVNTLVGGADWDEYLIFRTRAVPTPGTLTLTASALLLAGRRRRHQLS